MKKSLFFLVFSLISFNSTAGESLGCIWAKAKLKTAIEMQNEYYEKQAYYRRENGGSSDKYEFGLKASREDEKEAKAEVARKCKDKD